ncbi:MAG: hypothetical protein CO108_09935 [Deltaproteobacteria bacterium CG_4_9_14_3_um_filter_63_12]|nr:MAG: hypothetical protein CO108_09935 [Deltaproteobacteria bacterium CG_4_9_14_3_um_filter_63_12]
MKPRTELDVSSEDHQKAFTETSFLLEILTKTIGNVVGRSAPSLGVNAGRQMAKRMPIYLKDPELPEVLAAIANQMKAGFEIEYVCDETGAELSINRCAIREVCQNRGLALGEQTCTMFHYYLAGIAAELHGCATRPGDAAVGEECKFRLTSGRRLR